MRITVNLATRPFVELGPIYKRLRLWMLVLLVLAIPLWLLTHNMQQKAAAATEHVRTMRTKADGLERQQQNYHALMQQPQNAAVLAQSDFLNGIFRKKAFSWTATMTDLETVLPSGVQVMSIDPEVSKDGRVTIHLRVSGERQRAVELVKNLEGSRHFASPRLANESMSTANSGQVMAANASSDVNFDILADYRPVAEEETSAQKHPPANKKSGPQRGGK